MGIARHIMYRSHSLVKWLKKLQHGICRSHVLVFARKIAHQHLAYYMSLSFCEFIALGGVPFSFKTGGGMGMGKGKDNMCHRWL